MITAEQANKFTEESSAALTKALIPICEGAIIATAQLGGRSIDILNLVDKPTREALITNHNGSREKESTLHHVASHFEDLGFYRSIHVVKGAQPYQYAMIYWPK